MYHLLQNQEEVVVNGMSASTRSSRYANSGMVVAIETEDLQAYTHMDALAGLIFQQEMEKMAWEAGGKTQAAPAQRMVDFTNGKFSTHLTTVPTYRESILRLFMSYYLQ